MMTAYSCSVDIVPVVENRPSATIPAVVSTSAGTPSHHRQMVPVRRESSESAPNQRPIYSIEGMTCMSARNRRNIGSNTESQEDLFEETVRNRRNRRDNFKQKSMSKERVISLINAFENEGCPSGSRYSPEIDRSIASKDSAAVAPHKDRVERVHSLVAARSFATPEKLVLHNAAAAVNGTSDFVKDPSYNDWVAAHFPTGSYTVTIPRGNKGFGLIMVEGKVRILTVYQLCTC